MKKVLLLLSFLLSYSMAHAMDQEEPQTIGALIQRNNAHGDNTLHHAVKKCKKLHKYQKELSNETNSQESKKAIEANYKKKFECVGTSNLEEYSQFIHNNIIFLIQNLKETGFDFNAHNFDGKTALSLAVNYGSAKVVDALLEAGANPNICNKDGLTPLYIACRQKNNRIILENLLTKGAHIETLFVPVSEDVSTMKIQAALDFSLPNAVAITAHLKSLSPQKQQTIIASVLNRRRAIESEKTSQEKSTYNENRVQLKTVTKN